MGGLTAAGALAEYFEQVVVLERDTCHRRPLTGPERRSRGTFMGCWPAASARSAGWFPSSKQDLAGAGALPLRVTLDVRIEMLGYEPFPQRDLGLATYSMSRQLIELLVRQRVEQNANIIVRPRCRVRELVPSADRGAVIAVCFENADGKSETLPAELVVDASGRGSLTRSLLDAIGKPMPEERPSSVSISAMPRQSSRSRMTPHPIGKRCGRFPARRRAGVAHCCCRWRAADGW